MSDVLLEEFGIGTDDLLTPAEIEQRVRWTATKLKQAANEHFKACEELKDATVAWGRAEATKHAGLVVDVPDMRLPDVQAFIRLHHFDEWERFERAKAEEHKWRHARQSYERILRAFENHERFLERVVTR